MNIEEIVRKYKDNMIIYSSRFVKSKQDAEDIWQESCISIFKKCDTSFSESQIGAYVTRVVLNKTLDFLRKKNKRSNINQKIELDKYNNIEFRCYQDNLYDESLIEDASLSIKSRVYDSKDLSDLVLDKVDYKELAEKLGANPITVKVLKSRCKKILQENATIKELRA